MIKLTTYKEYIDKAKVSFKSGNIEEALSELCEVESQLQGELNNPNLNDKLHLSIIELLNKTSRLIQSCESSNYDEEDMINMMFPNGGYTDFDTAFGDDFFE